MSLDETRNSLRYVRICHLKIANEVDEGVVVASAAVLDLHDFQRIENRCNEAIGFRNELLGRQDPTTDMVESILAGDTVADAELFVGRRLG